jgi:hypothetical protein
VVRGHRREIIQLGGQQMNQKDYKKIAEIISAYFCKWVCKKDERIERLKKGMCEELADYFEEEDVWHDSSRQVFNRKQFLKDCGVE